MAPPAPGTTAFLPAEHRWLGILFSGLIKARVRVRDAVLADGAVRLTTRMPAGRPLVVTVRPVGSGEPGWDRTDRFVIGFKGGSARDPAVRRVLEVCRAFVEHLEPRMAPGLEGFAAVSSGEGHPEERLRRLFPFLDIEHSRGGGEEIVEVLVRSTRRCNQACPFCSSPDAAEPTGEALMACFRAVSAWLPGAMLTVTGGEPTLRPAFAEEVEAALDLPGIGLLQVQTNAVRLAAEDDVLAGLAPRDRLRWFVSLHALDEAIYDRCTATRGQMERAAEGIHRLLDGGHGVTVNTVVNRVNLDHLGDMVDQLTRRFAGENRPVVHYSVLICPERRPEAADYLVRYSDLAPALERASKRAEAAGFVVESLLSSTHASLPACTVQPRHRAARHRPVITAGETSYEDECRDTAWLKAPSCRTCDHDRHCLGVPRPYASHFGLDELQPIGRESR